MRYNLERQRFVKLCGETELLKTADMLAERSWFSWRHCIKRVRELKPEHKKLAYRLLRAAQWKRETPADDAERWFAELVGSKVDPLRFFVAQITPELYRDRLQPVLMDGKKIGVTLMAQRMKGGRARVYYSSAFNQAVELERVQFSKEKTGSDFLDSLGMFSARSTFHVKLKKVDAHAAS